MATARAYGRREKSNGRPDLPFRFLSADQHPIHDSISDFRKRHLKLLAGLFVQVLMLCGEAGLVKLGHVSIDGTKMKANASKHKEMSYQRMVETEKRLKEEVRLLLEKAKQEDESEDTRYGKGERGDDLPAELKRRDDRLKNIAEAKTALELHAQEKAAQEAEVAREKLEVRAQKERETGKKVAGRPPNVPDRENSLYPVLTITKAFVAPANAGVQEWAS